MSNQPTINLDQLLQTGAAAARGGNRPAARAIFLALGREHPDDPRVWLGLAAVTTDPDEQRAALEQALALDPANERARAALERLAEASPGPAEPRHTPVLPETLAEPPGQSTPASAPARPDQAAGGEAEPARTPFPLLNLLALLLILLLLGAVGVVIGRNLVGAPSLASAPTATPALAVIPALTTPPLAPSPAASAGAPATPDTFGAPATGATPETSGAPTTGAALNTSGAPTTGAPATPERPATAASPAATAATAAAPGPAAELPLGQVVDHDGWSATLLRPDYAVALDGAIGDLQPSGRFVLAVLAVSNNSPSPRVIPPTLFTLTDSTGRSYAPAPGASTAYLALYGRGQRGDLALEDPLDPSSGMRSVPALFDVPLDATGLRLTMEGAAGAGWPIGGSAPTTVGP